MTLLGDGRLRQALLVAVVVLVADQVTKALVRGLLSPHESLSLAPFAALTFVWNTGAAFGVLAAAPAHVRLPLFFAVTVLAAVVMLSFLRRVRAEDGWLVGGIGAILGGALGNAFCRLRYGAVVDFVDLHWGDLHWPAFNVADSAITVGVAVMLLASVRDQDLGSERQGEPQG